MLKTIILALALTASTTAMAGKTPSVTIKPNEITVAEDCDTGVFYSALIKSGEWAAVGQIDNWTYGSTSEETQTFVSAWNKAILDTSDANVVPGLVITDANQFISFIVDEDSGFPNTEVGQWLFLYKDGCFLDSIFIKKELPPEPIPAMTTGNPNDISSSFSTGYSFKILKYGT
jgi:hypothetical protein